MTFSIKSVLLTSALILSPLAAISPASAQVGVRIDLGNVGYGYRDGYVDRNNRYNRWQSAEHARAYRSQYRDYYTYENYDRNRHNHPHRGPNSVNH